MAANPLTKVFISYSRRDREVVSRLVDALEGADDIEVFRDTEDILPTEEWKVRLEQLIAQADTIVFALSPHSAASEVCAWEVEYAEGLNKRVAPIVIEDVEPEAIPQALTKYNYIFFTTPSEFDAALGNLITALNTNIDWIREHTRLGELAGRWDQQRQIGARYLRGQELADAEAWLATQPPNAPGPTNVHHEFILASRRAATKRQRMWIGGSLAALVVTSVLMVFAFVQMLEADAQRTEAERQREIAVENEATATRERDRAVTAEELAEERRREAEEQRTIADEQRAAAERNAELAEANEQRANRERDQAERERAIAQYRAALLSANEAKSLADGGEVDEALLLMLESVAGLGGEEVPESVQIALTRVLAKARGLDTVKVGANGSSFVVDGSLFYFDPVAGALFRFDGVRTFTSVADLAVIPAAMARDEADGTLVIAGRDHTVFRIDEDTGAFADLGSLAPLPEIDGRIFEHGRSAVHPDGLVVRQTEYSVGDVSYGLEVQVMDARTGQTGSWRLADVGTLRLVTMPDGRRYLTEVVPADVEARAFEIDLEAGTLDPVDIRTTPGVPENLSLMGCLGGSVASDDAVLQVVERRFAEAYPLGMECARFGDYTLLTEQYWSSGGGYEEYRIVTPDGSDYDVLESLRGETTFEDVVDSLSWIGIEAGSGRVGIIHGRNLYVFGDFGLQLNTTLPYASDQAHFEGPDRIVVAQTLNGQFNVFDLSVDPASVAGASTVTVDEAQPVVRYNIGNCAGFQSEWTFGPISFDNGDTVLFDDEGGAGPQEIVLTTATATTRLGFDGDYGLCAQFSRDLRWLLVLGPWGVRIRDFDVVRRGGDLEGAVVGSIDDTTIASAFFIGATSTILTGHRDHRVVRWTQGPDNGAWSGEEVYRAGAPVLYAEPDATGGHLLIIEDGGQAWYRTVYYSLTAGETWFDMGSTYKFTSLAFTEDLGIFASGFDFAAEHGQVITRYGVSELVDAARNEISPHCLPATPGDYASSPCWPASLSR